MAGVDWSSNTDPRSLAKHYTSGNPMRISSRKARLYAVACLRAADGIGWGVGSQLRAALDLVEQDADGQATDRELLDAYRALQPSISAHQHGHPSDALLVLLDNRPVGKVILEIMTGFAVEFWQRHSFPVDLMRETLGAPSGPGEVLPAWRTTDVMHLANGIYADRAFDRMPILADALQDAGCDAESLLSHLRDASAMHVRGCWALDLVLGKE